MTAVVLRALVVADDTPVRVQLTRALQRNADIAVVGQVSSAAEVYGRVDEAGADVVLLDLHLEDGSSQAAVEHVMALCPRPILLLSAPTDDRSGGPVSRALDAGAVDALQRPAQWTAEGAVALRHALHQVSKVHVIRHGRGPRVSPPLARPALSHPPVVAVAASTGGPSALAVVLAGLTGLRAPVLVVQHPHADFTGGLLDWMGRVSGLPVAAAEDGTVARAGYVYFAPGGVHLRLSANNCLRLVHAPVSLHRPSADELFGSVAETAGAAGVGVVLTGMGDDGARGLLALHQRGGRTLAQDEATCAVFGMPQAAQRLGAVTEMLALTLLAPAIHRAVAEVRA